ncbi:hypothetical protein ILUMI_16402 [Ignelater luminosus]|uniref:CCHC-type domain-containing protein n=1 Tax=Ignelater luminosus TaxID=2038154 RepID=A0A8K0G8L0_IGNLU|nr:hypothetical protein ILUMI_16402 [Ignelater luminosus]
MELAEGQVRAMRPKVDAVNKLGKPCYRCTRQHDPKSCPAKNWECYHCHKKGHTSQACRKPTVLVKEIEENGEPDEEHFSDLNFISEIQLENKNSLKVKLQMEGRLLDFEIDSDRYNLKVVTGESVKIIGKMKVTVACRNKIHCLPLVILDGSRKFMPLLSRNWLNVLKPNWKNLFHLGHVTHRDVKVVENKSEQQCTSG